ncbi:MAG: murein hydrolase activator EnvC family protein [bacterium]
MEKKIAANEKKETSVLYVLTNLDLEIDLTQSIIQNLKNEAVKKQKQIAKIEKSLKTTQKNLQQLKEIMRKRLVYFYKYGRMKDLELLLTARSFNQGLLWIEYQKRLSAQDYRNYIKIKENQAQIGRDRNLLTIELEEKRKLLRDKVKEEQNIMKKKTERQKVLHSIRQTNDLLRQQLAEKERSAAEIRKLIVQLESTPARAPLIDPGTPFTELQGRMIWPTHGKIIAKFGKYKHPVLKTVTENIGIDIQASLGSSVQAVANGRVTVITWQRGRGNIIIISHYGGYYTVYTHLEEIYIDLFEEVEMGQIIGNVGESGSLKGPMLHFEIWKGTEKLNPESWLGKQT